jgi:hypothetical protein
LNSLRSKIENLLGNRTYADYILDELLNTEISEDNYLDFFDAAHLIEIYEKDIHQRRMKVNLKMKNCHWLRYREMTTRTDDVINT